MASTSHTLVVPQLLSATMGAWPHRRPRLQAPAKPWNQTKAKFAMFPRQELFPGLGHLSNWPGSVSMLLIFPPQQQELAAREHPALIHLSVWSHTLSRANFAFETFERALCSCIIKDWAWSTFCWKVFLTRISSTRKCCFVRIEMFCRNILFVMVFLTQKNVSNSKSGEGISHCQLFHCRPNFFSFGFRVSIIYIQGLNIIKSPHNDL